MTLHIGSPCDLPPVQPKGALTHCKTCGEGYQSCEVVMGAKGETALSWIRLDEVPEDQRPAAGAMPTRIDLVAAPQGAVTPLVLDLGSEVAIVIQPKPDQRPGEIALNVVSAGGLDPEVVAWMLGLASEAITNGVRAQRLEQG